MKSWIHTARFSRSKSAEKGKRNFLHHRWHHCQEFNFCKIFPLGERIFLLSFDHHEFNLRTSIFPFQPGRIGRTSVQLGPCQIEAANNGCPHFPAGFKMEKNHLKISFYRRSAVVVVTIFTPNVVQLQGLAQILRWQPNFQETGLYFMVVIPHPWAWHGRGSDFKRPHKTVHSLEERGRGWKIDIYLFSKPLATRFERDEVVIFTVMILKRWKGGVRCNCIALLMKFVTKHRE